LTGLVLCAAIAAGLLVTALVQEIRRMLRGW